MVSQTLWGPALRREGLSGGFTRNQAPGPPSPHRTQRQSRLPMGLTDRPRPTPAPRELSLTSLGDPLLLHDTLAHPGAPSHHVQGLSAPRSRQDPSTHLLMGPPQQWSRPQAHLSACSGRAFCPSRGFCRLNASSVSAPHCPSHLPSQGIPSAAAHP